MWQAADARPAHAGAVFPGGEALADLLTSHLPACRDRRLRASACDVREVIAGRREKMFALADVTFIDAHGLVVEQRRFVLQKFPEHPSSPVEGAKVFRRLRHRVRNTPASKALRRWAAFLRAERLFIVPFPFDYRLARLAESCDPVIAASVLTQLAGVAPSRCSVTPIRYVPEKRCQIRYDLVTADGDAVRVFGKVMAGHQGARVVSWMQTLHESLAASGVAGTPAPVGYVRHWQMLVQREAPGRTIYDLQRENAAPASIYVRTGEALAVLQNTALIGLDRYTAQEELAVLAATLQRRVLVPDARAAAQALLDRLGATVDAASPAPHVTCHRDFYDKQVLAGQGIWVIDLDTLAEGPPSLDVGNFIAHLHLRQRQGYLSHDRLAGTIEGFLAGYRRHRPIEVSAVAWWTASALIRLASVYAVRPAWEHLASVLLKDADTMLAAHHDRRAGVRGDCRVEATVA